MAAQSRFKRRLSRLARKFRRLVGLEPKIQNYTTDWTEAQLYVGTDEVSGTLQFELLKKAGLKPSSKVLEVGCGALSAGVPIMRFLEPGGFAGIDPNAWTRESKMEEPEIAALVEAKKPRFLTRDDFDGADFKTEFDYILSHSVLSHAAHSQLEEFLRNTRDVLAPGGHILASLRLAEGNRFGNRGSRDGDDTRATEWQYPGGVWFKLSTVEETAARVGLVARYRPEFTEFYTQTRPRESHDWIEFTIAKLADKELDVAQPRAERSESRSN